MNKDNKTLQKLYESISEFDFIEVEEQFAEITAKGMIEKIYKLVARGGFPLKTTDISVLLRDRDLNESFNEDYFPSYQFIKRLDLDPKQKENFVRTFCLTIDSALKNILLIDSYNVKSIGFPRPFYADVTKAGSYIKKDFEDKEEIIKELENTLKIFMQAVMEDRMSKSLLTNDKARDYLSWRKEELKWNKLRNKLPELEGIL